MNFTYVVASEVGEPSTATTTKSTPKVAVVVSEKQPASKLFCLVSSPSIRPLEEASSSLTWLTDVLLSNLYLDL